MLSSGSVARSAVISGGMPTGEMSAVGCISTMVMGTGASVLGEMAVQEDLWNDLDQLL